MCMHVWVHVNAKRLCGCVRACDCAEATRILSCHISVRALEEKRSKAGPLVGLWFQQTHLIHSRLRWEKKENSIVFVRVIHEPKPQRVLLPPALYAKQFKWCNLQEILFFFSFPRLNFLGKEIEVSSSASERGVFSRNCLLFWMRRLVFSPSDSLQRN